LRPLQRVDDLLLPCFLLSIPREVKDAAAVPKKRLPSRLQGVYVAQTIQETSPCNP
jgi:hypothetical protein